MSFKRVHVSFVGLTKGSLAFALFFPTPKVKNLMGVLPYISHTGISAALNGRVFAPFWSESGIDFAVG